MDRTGKFLTKMVSSQVTLQMDRIDSAKLLRKKNCVKETFLNETTNLPSDSYSQVVLGLKPVIANIDDLIKAQTYTANVDINEPVSKY